jgi:hypothetical protein
MDLPPGNGDSYAFEQMDFSCTAASHHDGVKGVFKEPG